MNDAHGAAGKILRVDDASGTLEYEYGRLGEVTKETRTLATHLNGYEHHRVFHHENEFARGKSHVNGIENFWSFAKGRLAKFNGCASDKFVLHLKECEWQYNHRHEDLLPLIKKLFRFANF